MDGEGDILISPILLYQIPYLISYFQQAIWTVLSIIPVFSWASLSVPNLALPPFHLGQVGQSNPECFKLFGQVGQFKYISPRQFSLP